MAASLHTGYISSIMQEIKLSVSKTKTFLDCKAKYHFGYIQKLPRKDWSFHIFGKFVHQVFEDFHLAYINGSTEPYNIEMSKAYKSALVEYKEKMSVEDRKAAYDIVDKYLKQITSEKNAGTLPNFLAAEKDFAIEITTEDTKIILNGQIDRVQIDADGVLHVCDYKTVKNKKYLKNDFFQLLTYAFVLCMEDPTITRVRGSYILLRHDCEYITKEFSIEEIMEIKEKFIKYAEQIHSENLWRANPTPLCNFCDYLKVCEDGKKKYGADESTDFGEVKWV